MLFFLRAAIAFTLVSIFTRMSICIHSISSLADTTLVAVSNSSAYLFVAIIS